MDRDEIMARVAEWFDIEPNEDGTFDIGDYDWRSGCSMGPGGRWLTLAEVVFCIESIMEELEY